MAAAVCAARVCCHQRGAPCVAPGRRLAPALPPRAVATARGMRCRASSGDSEAGVPPALSLSEAYSLLGLNEDASYDAVLSAKNRLVEKYGQDFDRRMQVEAAYDLIFSNQLRARLTGDLPVATNVRFADVRRRPSAPAGAGSGAAAAASGAAEKAQALLQNLRPGTGGGITIRQPPPRAVPATAAVFGGLAAWTLAQGLLEPTPQAAAADVPSLQLALATAATVYLLRENKGVGLGKATGLALAGLVAGTFVGAAVQSWLRVDIIPLGSLASPGILVGEFSIAGLAAVCFLLA